MEITTEIRAALRAKRLAQVNRLDQEIKADNPHEWTKNGHRMVTSREETRKWRLQQRAELLRDRIRVYQIIVPPITIGTRTYDIGVTLRHEDGDRPLINLSADQIASIKGRFAAKGLSVEVIQVNER